jgi:hypothetical protein
MEGPFTASTADNSIDHTVEYSPVQEPVREDLLSPEELDHIRLRGRLLFRGMPQTADFFRKRGTNPGQKNLVDERSEKSRDINISRRLLDLNGLVGGSLGPASVWSKLREQGINRAIYMVPAIKKEVIYKKVVVKKLFSSQTIEQEDGIKDVPILINEFYDDPNMPADEQAYILNYYISGTKKDEFEDTTSKRPGRMAYFSVVLPESDAKVLYARISENARILDQVFDAMDHDLMEDQKVGMPVGDKVFVKPLQGNPYEFDARDPNRMTQIREDFIKPY